MNKGILLLGLMAAGLANPSLASSAREMGQSELRQIASMGNTVSLKATLSSVSKSLQASVVDAQAIHAGDIYYRIVLKNLQGQLVSVVIDAQTGGRISAASKIGREVLAAQ